MSVAALAVSLLLAQTLGPEAGFGTPTPAAAAGDQDFPSLAACGGGYLLAWSDRRADPDVELLFVSRLAPDGAVKDTNGVHLPADTHDLRGVTVTCGATVALVSWVDGVHDALHAVRVDPSTLAVLDPLALPVSPFGFGVGFAHVAFDGAAFVFTFTDTASYPDLWATRVSEQGALLDATPWAVASGPGAHFGGQLACQAGTCLATWRDTAVHPAGDVYGGLLTNGALSGSAFPISVGDAGVSSPSVGVGPNGYLVVWPDSRAGPQDLYAARVDFTGGVLDPSGIALHTPTGASETGARIAWDGAHYQVAWTTQNFSLRATRVDEATGAVLDLDSGVRLRSASVNALDLAPADGGTFLAWSEAPVFDQDLFGSRLDPSLTLAVDGGAMLTGSANAQLTPALAAGAGELLVAWADTRLGSSRVLASRVDLNGTPEDGAGFVFTANPGPEVAPTVAYGAGVYLVAFQEDSSHRIWGRRYSADAGLLDVAPLNLSGASTAPSRFQASAAFDGSHFLVVWSEAAANVDVVGMLLSPDGTVAVPPFAIATGASDQYAPAVAAVGNAFQVIWVGETSYPWVSLFGGRVSDTGAVLDGPGGVNLLGQTTGLDQVDSLALSCDVTRCLAAYRIEWSAVFGLWLEGNASLSTPVRLGGLGYGQAQPALVFDGKQWQAALLDYVLPSGAGLVTQTVPYQPGPPSTPRLLLNDSPLQHPALAFLGPGRLALAYSQFDDAPTVEADRLKVRLLYALAEGADCSADAQCSSGHCADGVCCDAACNGGPCQACTAAKGATKDGACTLLDASHACRPQYSSCDVAESCDGVGPACPADQHAPDTTPCDATGTCTMGVCIGGVPPTNPDAGPGFTSLPGSTVRCGDTFHYGGGGPQVMGPGPVTYSLAPGASEKLPDGLTVDAATGELSWLTRRDQAGTWHPVLIAQGNGWNAGQTLTIEVYCPQVPRSVGCSAFAGPFGLLALAWALTRKASRHRRD